MPTNDRKPGESPSRIDTQPLGRAFLGSTRSGTADRTPPDCPKALASNAPSSSAGSEGVDAAEPRPSEPLPPHAPGFSGNALAAERATRDAAGSPGGVPAAVAPDPALLEGLRRRPDPVVQSPLSAGAPAAAHHATHALPPRALTPLPLPPVIVDTAMSEPAAPSIGPATMSAPPQPPDTQPRLPDAEEEANGGAKVRARAMLVIAVLGAVIVVTAASLVAGRFSPEPPAAPAAEWRASPPAQSMPDAELPRLAPLPQPQPLLLPEPVAEPSSIPPGCPRVIVPTRLPFGPAPPRPTPARVVSPPRAPQAPHDPDYPRTF